MSKKKYQVETPRGIRTFTAINMGPLDITPVTPAEDFSHSSYHWGSDDYDGFSDESMDPE